MSGKLCGRKNSQDSILRNTGAKVKDQFISFLMMVLEEQKEDACKDSVILFGRQSSVFSISWQVEFWSSHPVAEPFSRESFPLGAVGQSWKNYIFSFVSTVMLHKVMLIIWIHLCAADRSFCDDIAHPWSSSSHLSGAADRLDESFLGQDRLPHLPFVLYCLGFTLQLLGLQLFLEKAEFVGDLNLYSMLDWDSTNHTDWNIFSW